MTARELLEWQIFLSQMNDQESEKPTPGNWLEFDAIEAFVQTHKSAS